MAAYKTAHLIARPIGNHKASMSKLDQMTCENVDEENIWSIMKNKDIHAHLKTKAQKVASLITIKYNQSTDSEVSEYKKDWRTPTKAVKQNAMTLTVEKAIHTQPTQETFNVIKGISMSTTS